LVLVVAVVVYRDNAASDVGVGADGCVAQVAQVAGFGAASDARFFCFDEIADSVVAREFGAGAKMGEGADFGVLADHAILGAHA